MEKKVTVSAFDGSPIQDFSLEEFLKFFNFCPALNK